MSTGEIRNYENTWIETYPRTGFVNPFTGKTEEYRSERDANAKMLASAAQRINDLQAEIDKIKAFLVI